MCIELQLTESERRAALRLREAQDHGSPAWEARVARAVDGMGGPLANEFCNLAGLVSL
jgi:hypothetical protein